MRTVPIPIGGFPLAADSARSDITSPKSAASPAQSPNLASAASFDGPPREDGRSRPQIDIPPGVSLEDLERAAVEKALQLHQGNRTHAAKMLGISVRTLQRKLKAWRIPTLMLRHPTPARDYSYPYSR